ncbi:MAG: PKD domain-containing protein [Chitinophagales bacterium]
MKRVFYALLFLMAFKAGSAQGTCTSDRYKDTVFHSLKITTGVKFGTATPWGVLAQPQDLYMDIYEPANDTLAKRPIIVFQFGGGFTIGWRTEPDIPGFCEYFAKCGYVVATIDYRIGLDPLDTGSTVRAYYRGVQDERSALRYLAANANQLKIDTNWIFLTGTSAGCFCALANSYTTDADRPASTYGTFLEPDDLGCMDCSGNNLFGKRIPKIKAIINQWGAILDTNYITTAENVPVISFHGDQDILVPYVYGYPFQLPVFPKVYGSVPIHQRLNNLGILNEFHPLVGYGHEPELLAPQLNDTIRNYSRVFLAKMLKPVTSPISGTQQLCLGTIATYNVTGWSDSYYCWQLTGNGQIISNTGQSVTVLWSDTGTVGVSVRELSLQAAEGELQTFSSYVAPMPLANFGYVQDGLQVTLANWSQYAGTYVWYFGDGSSSSDVSPVKNYSSGATYQVTLVAGNNICTDTFSTQLQVDSCPVAGIHYQITNFNGVFRADTTNTALYYWYFGDGDSAAVAYPSVFHQFQQYGVYTVILKVRNQFGCEHADTVTVSLLPSAIEENSISPVTITCNTGLQGCFIANQAGQPMTVSLYSIAGQLIWHETSAGDMQVPGGNLPAGVYIVQVQSSHFSRQLKFKVD